MILDESTQFSVTSTTGAHNCVNIRSVADKMVTLCPKNPARRSEIGSRNGHTMPHPTSYSSLDMHLTCNGL